ncbi:MAG: hypothetical protein B7Z66_13055 [Chromatiales bacterium 21-64-14]|nr:MAG: hypothetical protein B7Z66_13055 [Chromatiales bacterium 21-64-14]HQU17076.1 hypothetical protein [Gammaproteobacteria bacterium]
MAREVRFDVRLRVPGTAPGSLRAGLARGAGPEVIRLAVERRGAGERRLLERREDHTRCLSCRRKVTRRGNERRR